MDKNQMVSALQNARKSHKLQMHTIKAMIKGNKATKELEVDKYKCEFGKWLYSDENRLKHVLGSQFYAKLDDEHTRWHSECHKISDILSVKEEKGFISKLINPNKSHPMKYEKADIYYEQLKIKTDELLKIMTSSERRLLAMHDDRFVI